MANKERNIILEVRNLDIGYTAKGGNSIIAQGMNFSLSEGELVGLVGANGIGKSTLLRTLTGMQKALKGAVSINGKPLESYSSFQLATLLSVVLTEPPATKIFR